MTPKAVKCHNVPSGISKDLNIHDAILAYQKEVCNGKGYTKTCYQTQTRTSILC